MSPSLKYAATGLAGIASFALVLWPFMDPASRNGILLAGAVALPVQTLAFAGLRRFRQDTNRFLVVWLGGTLVRLAVVVVVATLVIRSGMEGAVAMLLALAGFFFGLLLLEPIYFRPGPSALVDANGVEA